MNVTIGLQICATSVVFFLLALLIAGVFDKKDTAMMRTVGILAVGSTIGMIVGALVAIWSYV